MNLAILIDPEEDKPPSTKATIDCFVKAGKRNNTSVDLIYRDDFCNLINYHALFIRQTTSLNNETILFSKEAERLGLIVVDDYESIIKCTDKIYQYELMKANGIRHIESAIINKDSKSHDFEYPVVVKIPDGTFSKGVYKVNSETEYDKLVKELFSAYKVLLVQEYAPTEFDWRIGIFGGRVIFVCRYYMARGHWQIINYEGAIEEGRSEGVRIEDAPREVLNLALRMAGLIGEGLYGVDIEETKNGFVVVEINDNPSVESGVEDEVEGDILYDSIIQEFKKRVEAHGRVSNQIRREAGHIRRDRSACVGKALGPAFPVGST